MQFATKGSVLPEAQHATMRGKKKLRVPPEANACADIVEALRIVLPANLSRNDVSGCLEWQACRNPQGYGQIRLWDQKTRMAHRVAWELQNGAIPDGLFILHKCDNPRCCNVEHLFLGTPADNVHDMIAKRRHAYGERWPGTKLTAEQVLEIRRIGPGHSREIAPRFGVTARSIRRIVEGTRRRIL